MLIKKERVGLYMVPLPLLAKWPVVAVESEKWYGKSLMALGVEGVFQDEATQSPRQTPNYC